MTATTHTKEELYVRRLFDDDAPVFVDVTRYVRQEQPYPLSAKRALKATCGVRTDGEVVAFSLRNYTGKQAEKEVENVEHADGDRTRSENLLRLRMPRKTLHDLNERARELSPILDGDVVVELDDALYVLALSREGGEAALSLGGKLTRSENGYVRSEIADTDTEFELPITGVRLRVFLRSPVRERILAFGFAGYLTRKPGEMETVTRATALALNSLSGLATFRLLSGLEHVDVPQLPPGAAMRVRPPEERIVFTVPVALFAEDGTPAARGSIGAEIDQDHVDPVTGGLRLHLEEGPNLEWNPALAGAARFADYEKVLTETITVVIQSALGVDVVRDLAYDIMLADVGEPAVAALRGATADVPLLAATPYSAEVRQADSSAV